MISRRSFLNTGTLAFLGLHAYASAEQVAPASEPFGPLIADPDGIIDLPQGFSYRILAKQGEPMDDGFVTPGLPDGMAAFAAPDGKLVLVCNHELDSSRNARGPFKDNSQLPDGFDPADSYDSGKDGKQPFLGGTSNLVFDPATGQRVAHFLSLTGTDRNCAGGAMPWGSWITCEEPGDLTSERGLKHGWCFEVKATAEIGIQKPVPLKALGRFRHEAVALDPLSGILYLTEDRNDGLLYRFIPAKKGDFSQGQLQALMVVDQPSADLRNYDAASKWPAVSQKLAVRWIDLADTDAPQDDLRQRGFKDGAARFARGEGIHYTDGAFFICCTDGGPTRRGQIFRLDPAADAAAADQLELFLQPGKSDLLTNGDNLCPAPWGGIVVCEDLIDPKFSPAAHVRCVTLEGKIHTLARNRHDGEFAGCCFSPDGKWFFVNIMAQGLVLAITGPWEKA
ncbi:MAG: alkaline phosphatase PhoX [Verrucomicrobiota bacterium]